MCSEMVREKKPNSEEGGFILSLWISDQTPCSAYRSVECVDEIKKNDNGRDGPTVANRVD